MGDNVKELSSGRLLTRTKESVDKLHKAISAVRSSDLSPKEKKIKIDKLRLEINKAFKTAVSSEALQ